MDVKHRELFVPHRIAAAAAIIGLYDPGSSSTGCGSMVDYYAILSCAGHEGIDLTIRRVLVGDDLDQIGSRMQCRP